MSHIPTQYDEELHEEHSIDVAPGLASRIAVVIGHFRTKSAAALCAGVEVNTLGRWTDDTKIPNPNLLGIARLLIKVGMSMDWLISGEEPRYLPGRSPRQQYEEIREQSASYELLPLHTSSHDSPRRNIHFPVTGEELVQHRLSRDQLGAYILEDDAMQPLLERGSVILVDHRYLSPCGANIYLLEFRGEMLARRLQRTMNGLTLICDTPLLENIPVPEEALDQVKILGRIVWSGGWL